MNLKIKIVDLYVDVLEKAKILKNFKIYISIAAFFIFVGMLFLWFYFKNNLVENKQYISDDSIRKEEVILDSLFSSDLKAAEAKSGRFYIEALESKDSERIAYAYYFKAATDIRKNKMDSILFFAEKAFEYAVFKSDLYLKAKVDMVFGRYYLYMDDFPKSLQYYYEAMSYFTKAEDLLSLGSIYNDLGILYFNNNELEEAVKQYEKALDIFEETKTLRGKAITYANLSNVYLKQQNLDGSRKSILESLDVFEALNDSLNIIKSFITLSDIDRNQGKLKSALRHLEKAYQKTFRDDAPLRGVILVKTGDVYEDMQNYIQAQSYYEKGLKIGNEVKLKQVKLGALRGLADLNIALKNHKLANDFLIEYYQLRDSIRGTDTTQKIEEIKWSYSLKEKQYENEILNNKYELQVQQHKNLRKIYIIVIISAFSTIFLIWLLYRNKNKSLRISELEKERLTESIENKQKLQRLKEEHHRLEIQNKNRQLTAINIQLLSKNELLTEMEAILKEKTITSRKKINNLEKIIRHIRDLERDWGQFKEVFESVHPNFFNYIHKEFPQLSKTEERICAYIKINMSNHEIASLLNISQASLMTSRYRIRKKINLKSEDSLDEVIQSW